MNKLPIEIIRELLLLEFPTVQKIFFDNQENSIQPNLDTYITIQTRSSKVYGNSIDYVYDDINFICYENKTVNTLETYIINMYGKKDDGGNDTARVLSLQIPLALQGYNALATAEQYQFKIFTIGEVQNISEVEGGSMFNRYAFTLQLLSWYTKTTSVPYYDNFTKDLIVEI